MATVTLQFIQYNNYFNKILKKPENPFFASSYEDYPEKAYITGVAFNENDGVTTSQVVNNDIDDVGDYLLVLDGGDNVISHWFVVEATRNRLGQCVVRLQRDLLVDYYEKIKTAPAFIERGMLNNDDPMIFNDEGLSFNQIKIDAKPLFDASKCAWIIGYIAKDASITNNTLEVDVSETSTSPDYTFSSWDDAPQELQDLITGTKSYYQNIKKNLTLNEIGYRREIDTFKCYYVSSVSAYKGNASERFVLDKDTKFNGLNGVDTIKSIEHNLRNLNIERKALIETFYDCLNACGRSLIYALDQNSDDINTSFGLNYDLTDTIDTYDGTVISVGGTTYTIKKEIDDSFSIDDNLENKLTLKNKLATSMLNSDALVRYTKSDSGTPTASDITNLSIKITATRVYLSAVQTGAKANVSFLASTSRQHTLDAQYDIFAIPFPVKHFNENGLAKFFYPSETSLLDIDGQVSIAAACALATALGGGTQNSKIYDLQILPYCPNVVRTAPFYYWQQGTKYYPVMPSESIGCSYIKVNNIVKSFILYCSSSEFSIDINEKIDKSDNPKEQKQLFKYRLTSGNYSSMFDFTPDMNGGVKYFKAYCNYKPYKPFIKVNPYFDYLYGSETFKDANGLILSGDFSVTMMSDAWTNYLIQNKNFEAMFDRQIQTVELGNQVAYTRGALGLIGATFGGAVGGAVAGSKFGAAGAVGGAIGGAVTGTAGSLIELTNQVTLREDSLDLQRAMHAYRIDNIKALPDTIQKVSNLNIVDKIVPLIETYCCTQEEIEHFRSYIRYNGMSVGRIDMIQNFESNGGFIQGRFIRLEGLSEDYHLANAINTTFQAGFYFMEE